MAANLPRTTRTFVDSTVLFAAAYSAHGRARDLLLAGIRGDLSIVLSDLVLAETERNLAAKAPRALPYFQALRAILLPFVVNPSDRVIQRAARSVERKDAAIVAGAVGARARYLATYDRRHLLNHAEAIRTAFGVLVMTPDGVLASIGGHHR